jgi:hypothetical protein
MENCTVCVRMWDECVYSFLLSSISFCTAVSCSVGGLCSMHVGTIGTVVCVLPRHVTHGLSLRV